MTVDFVAAPAGAIATVERPATVRAEVATMPTVRKKRFVFIIVFLLVVSDLLPFTQGSRTRNKECVAAKPWVSKD